ncbi:alpha/beta fold hydrolase [Paenibacillus rhizophilus]|uniref:alpha/beta fold hydrolase n=1 Tax=Paenibacillus rhizophilus TaxID=1850366 RepID=UPI001C89A8CF|nr:alpha/beta hydrolase [Paenibacillus rhizophilus]
MFDYKSNYASVSYTRKFFEGPDTTLSYIDFGGKGFPMLALHGHMNEGLLAQGLAGALAGEYRVITLDQRGHGESGRPLSYDNDRYVDDVLALLDHLGIDHAALLGHSLGGVVAYRLAAGRNGCVRWLSRISARSWTTI